jgi:hypothetical protein
MARHHVALILALALVPLQLWAAPTKKAILKLDIKPAEVQILVDEKPVGHGGKEHTVSLAPGRHTVKLVRKGMSHEESITLKTGETKSWSFVFGGSDSKDDQIKLEDPSKAEEPAATPE